MNVIDCNEEADLQKPMSLYCLIRGILILALLGVTVTYVVLSVLYVLGVLSW